ncbi:MAG: chemotaxis protein CheW [Actinomycetota bacterium]|nr:MAG: purine-binding chemotaxis protein [Actinomycetota bacterium]MDO8949123.1 chemotaxis protein CheW [Actinomycetota bacterium]MDP3630888.1 chemotaxis protein CheW [Actinomycetota bacterium]
MTDIDPLIRQSVASQSLDILRKRAESLAQVEEIEATAEMFALLCFRLGSEWYAVRIADVREIHNDFVVASIPRVPSFILGVINVRGEIISVTDTAALIGIASDGVHGGQEMSSAIIVHSELCVSALVVDEIGDIIEIRKDAVEPPLSTYDRSQVEFVSGSVYVDGRLIGLVNLEKVLEPIGEKA